MRILIVEDHARTASYLQKGLKEQRFATDVALDGQEGLHLAMNNAYDVIILDVMLPYLDGWTLIKTIRANDTSVPILFLTAKDTIDDRVKGLELGADDYLIKPFAFSELLARLRTIVRRNQPQTAQHSLHIDDLIIYPHQYRVTRADHTLNLTAKEFMLLLLFAHRLGEPLSRTYISEQVWDIYFDCDTNIIDVAVKRLRDKMDKPFANKLIHTVRGVGYVMEIR